MYNHNYVRIITKISIKKITDCDKRGAYIAIFLRKKGGTEHYKFRNMTLFYQWYL